MVNETVRVAAFTAELSKWIFKRCQRTSPEKTLDQNSPNDCREMQRCNPTPPKGEQSAKNDEKDEAEMQGKHKVG